MITKHAPAYAILTIHFIIFAILNQYLSPHPDMVDHWVWSRFLSLSYFEHPPMIALLIRGITLIGGNSEVALEIGSQLVTLSILALVYFGANRLYGRDSALVTLLILCGMPYFTIGSIFLHITQPFMFFWIISLMLLVRYHQTLNTKWLLWIGVAAGLGALSKYIMLLFYMSMFLHFLLYRNNRKEVFNQWVYVAGIISLLVFIPVLLWNAQNDWISFRWQLNKGTSGADFGEKTLAFTVGHLFLFSPIWAVLYGFGLWWMRDRLTHSRSPESVIVIVSMFPLFFFTLMSLKGTISDPHWVNLSYLGMAIVMGNQLIRRIKKQYIQLFILLAFALNLGLTGFAVKHTLDPFYDWLPYELKNFDYLKANGVSDTVLEKLKKNRVRLYSKADYQAHLKSILSADEVKSYGELIEKTASDLSADRLTRILDWQDTGERMGALLKEKQITELEFIVSREYQLSSVLSFYIPDQPWPHSIEKAQRNIWSPIDSVKSSSSIFVCELQECQGNLVDFQRRFQMNLEYLGEVETRKDMRVIRNIQMYKIQSE